MSNIELSFFGPPRFRVGGQEATLRTAKAVALLAYLVVARERQMRDHLADFLWPESAPDAARKNLRNTLWTLRSTLDETVVTTDGEWVVLGPVHSDVAAFERGVDALTAGDAQPPGEVLTLYRGPLAEGLVVDEAPEFELWLGRERARLERRYLQAIEARVVAHLAAGEWDRVIDLGGEGLRHDPLNEPVARALMVAHGRRGARNEALRQYEQLRDRLARELGVAPLPETEALHDALLAGEPGELTTTPAPPARAPARPRPARPVVGRVRERLALDEALAESAAGHARVRWLTGELGIGKSTLWEGWSAALPEAAVAVTMRCLDTTQALPFAPLAALLREPAVEPLWGSGTAVALLWQAELARLVPEIRQKLPQLPVPLDLPAEEERHRLFEALARLLTALDGRPLVLFLDDAHWADHATLDALVYLLDRMRAAPLLLVAAYRPADAPSWLLSVVAGWNRDGIGRTVPLEPFSREESQALLAGLGAAAQKVDAARLHVESGGNPFFLLELARSGGKDAPRALAELISTRLRGLGDVVRQVVQAAAVLQSEITFDLLRRTGGRSEEETIDALDRLVEEELFVEHADHYHFAHPFVAAVVRRELSIARRSFLHRRAAEGLVAIHGESDAGIAGSLARHYERAGQPARAAAHAARAGRHALGLFAPAEAAAAFEQALRLEPTPERRLGLAEALLLLGDQEAARRALRLVLDEVERDTDAALAAEAALLMGRSHLPGGGVETARWARYALDLGPALDPALRTRAHLLLGAGLMVSDHRLDEAARPLERANDLVAAGDDPLLAAESRFQLGNLLAQRGDFAAAIARYEEAIALAEEAQDLYLQILIHNNLAYHALLAGQIERAGRHNARSRALSDAAELSWPRQFLESTRGEIALARGRLDEAETAFSAALAVAERGEARVQAANIRANRALVARARGDLDGALVMLERAAAAVEGQPVPHLQIQLDLWLTETHLAREEVAAARETLARAGARLQGSGRRYLADWAARLATEIERWG